MSTTVVSSSVKPKKITRAQMMAQIRARVKAQKAEKKLLEGGLFRPTQHDLDDELNRMSSYRDRNFHSRAGEEVYVD